MTRPTAAEQAARFNEDYAQWFLEATAQAGNLITRQIAADLLGVAYNAITAYAKRGRIRTYTYCYPDGAKTIPLYSLTDVISIGLAAKAKAMGNTLTEEQIQSIFAQAREAPIYSLADEEYKATRRTDTKKARARKRQAQGDAKVTSD